MRPGCNRRSLASSKRSLGLARTIAHTALVLGLASCGESTGPGTFAVSLTATPVDAPHFNALENGQPIIACHVALAARAVGVGSALWDSATFYFYLGKDRSVPADSGMVAATEVAAAWGKPRIEPGDRPTSGWTFSTGAPFSVKIVVGYRRDGGKRHTATASFDCGPSIPATVTPPVITSLTVTPETDISPGQVLTVNYAITSGIGLWETVIELFGACDTTIVQGEWLAATASHSPTMTLPSTCALDQPLGIVVHAFDAALELTSRQVSLTVADKVLPTMTVNFASAIGTPLIGPIAGEFFAGQELKLVLSTEDNVGVQKIFWEVVGSGRVDSASVSGLYTSQAVTMPIPASLDGTIQIRAWSRDVAGNLSTRFTSAAGAIRVYPTVVRPRYSALVYGDVRDFVIDMKRNQLYLMQTNEARISIFSMTTRLVTQVIHPSSTPLNMDLTTGGDSLIMTLYGSKALHVLDLRDPATPITSIPLTLPDGATYPGEVRIVTGAKAIVGVSGTFQDSKRVLEVDLGTGAQRFLTAGESPLSGEITLERSHDRNSVVIGGISGGVARYDATTGAFGPARAVTGTAWRNSVNANGTVTASGLNVYGESLQFLRSMSTFSSPGAYVTAISASGEYVYAINWLHGIVRLRVSDGSVADRFEIFMNPDIVRVSPDGTLLVYSTRTYSNTNRIGWSDLR